MVLGLTGVNLYGLIDKTLFLFKREIAVRIPITIWFLVHICSYFNFLFFYFVQFHLHLYITQQFFHLKIMFLLNLQFHNTHIH